jgi:hypothetical protein
MKNWAFLIVIVFCAVTFEITAYGQTCPLAAGCLDPTFGSGGTVAIPVPSPGSRDTVPRDIVAQSDGKIVVMFGCCSTWGLMRINADGSLDTSFGINGFMITTWDFTYKNFIYHNNTNAIALQQVNGEQRILVAGQSAMIVGNKVIFTRLRVDRYTANGVLDTSFGNDGVSMLNVGSAQTIAVQPSDQKILTDGESYGELVRLNVNGYLDMSFGNAGTVDTGATTDMAVDATGRILVSGRQVVGKGNKQQTVSTVKRYFSGGSLDTSFGTNGTATIGYSQSFSVIRLKVDPFGNVVVAGSLGSVSAGNADFAVARLTENGLLDTSFNGSGKASASLTPVAGLLSSMGIQADGKIVLIGAVNPPGSTIRDAGVARFTFNGALDSLFGNGGSLTFDIDGDDYFSPTGGGGLVQLDPTCGCEKIIVASGTPGYTTFARLTTF